MERYFAPLIIGPDGTHHKMAVAELPYPGAPLKIYPFKGEIHSTRYIGPKIKVTISKKGELIAALI